MTDLTLEERFDLALLYVENKYGREQYPDDDEMSNEDKLEYYGLFKVIKSGKQEDNMDKKPGMLNFEGKYKWKAWGKVSELSKEECMKKYLEKMDAQSKGKWMEFEKMKKHIEDVIAKRK